MSLSLGGDHFEERRRVRRRRRWRVVVGAFAFTSLWAAQLGRDAYAQAQVAEDGAPAEEAPAVVSDAEAEEVEETSPSFGTRQAEPWLLTPAQLDADGWQYSNLPFRPQSTLARALAPTVGSLVHGAGHFAMDDRRSAYRLLAVELGSVVLATTGHFLRNARSDRDGMVLTGTALQVAAGGSFMWSWIADVVGTYKNASIALPDLSDEPTGLSMSVFYTSVFGAGAELGSIAAAGLSWRSGRFLLELDGEFGPARSYYSLTARGALRVRLGEMPRTAVDLIAVAGEQSVGDDGWGRNRLAAGLGLTLDLGELLPHAAGVLWKFEVLGWADFYFFDALGNERFRRGGLRWHMPVETGIGMNISQGVYVEVGYRHRADLLLGGLFPSGGALYQRLSIHPVDALGIELIVEEGLSPRLWIGLRWQIFEHSE